MPADHLTDTPPHQAAGLAALERRADTVWYQLRVQFADWDTAERVGAEELESHLDELQDSGAVAAWWFLRKYPCWRLRLRAPDTTAVDQGSLSEITTYLVARDLDRGVEEEEHPGQHALFRATLRQIFTDDLTPGQLHLAADPMFPGSFDALATEQRRLSDPAANSFALQVIRESWGLLSSGP